MLTRNVEEILSRLSPEDLVLDVGAWACPFNRAHWILDAEPYETRGFYRTFGAPPFHGPPEESFSAATWVRRDICDREPWPFPDKHFDFVICSHTLEDVRDPLWICSELTRVGKAGYVEIPSRLFETSRGVERPGMAGLSHHRWLIDIEGSHLRFWQKLHMIHERRFSLPERYRRRLTEESSVQWLFWDGAFTWEETTILGVPAQEAELSRYARSIWRRPGWLEGLDAGWRGTAALSRRVAAAIRRRL
jgi:Methyltransferase domain